MHRLLSRQGIRYTCRLLTENSKRAFLILVTKIQRPKILKWKKKNLLITKKQKQKKTPASSMTPACAFSMNQSSVQAIHSEGKGLIPVSVACFGLNNSLLNIMSTTQTYKNDIEDQITS